MRRGVRGRIDFVGGQTCSAYTHLLPYPFAWFGRSAQAFLEINMNLILPDYEIFFTCWNFRTLQHAFLSVRSLVYRGRRGKSATSGEAGIGGNL